ncbi:uncharacterized protein A1O9_07157 [Exophiala aquamarina CBS 119918]|uniref:Glucose-inducible SAM-dependent methyltransferase Rrg1 n=1 Tax=Exophiala aquamarina CBS 119918 TaxID=1182545 RepID=A0A072PB21_9EURO|nr:uncharacterized protein A1O9_07157 [Exophiala aquamarina CBS 119918]KEF56967.1 hypothetical protein A1O9_07157 [Exophiala aquamarina CBS 119918]
MMVQAVHDLPQLYQKPSASALLDALALLSLQPSAFVMRNGSSQSQIAEQGIPRYLTSIVASSLAWIDDDDVKESIWSAASTRLSERSGRNAMPDLTRTFAVGDGLSFHLREPSLTGDNLGLKTWTSSLLLSQRLPDLRKYIENGCPSVLELGSGTGLVGMAAACAWNVSVLLTDLPEIVPNLQHNLERNKDMIEENHGSVAARRLDWDDEADLPRDDQEKFMVILAADPIYSNDHPQMLARTVRRWIHPDAGARFIVELPLRDRYDEERQSLRDNLRKEGFDMIAEGHDVGHDDWHGRDGLLAEVHCWWSVWQLVSKPT